MDTINIIKDEILIKLNFLVEKKANTAGYIKDKGQMAKQPAKSMILSGLVFGRPSIKHITAHKKAKEVLEDASRLFDPKEEVKKLLNIRIAGKILKITPVKNIGANNKFTTNGMCLKAESWSLNWSVIALTKEVSLVIDKIPISFEIDPRPLNPNTPTAEYRIEPIAEAELQTKVILLRDWFLNVDRMSRKEVWQCKAKTTTLKAFIREPSRSSLLGT